jgi:class 3 adenylate cyclase
MQAFYALIDRLDRCEPGEKEALEALLWSTFGIEACVLALDMTGFSRTVQAQGIVSYLARIRRMQQVSAPVVAGRGGEVVKYTADNLMAVFTDASQAVAAARDIRRACLALAEPLEVSIGLDYGRFLYVSHSDCFGDPVNVAFKLAEDIAGTGEVLASAAVLQATEAAAPAAWHEAQVSGLRIAYAQLTAD